MKHHIRHLICCLLLGTVCLHVLAQKTAQYTNSITQYEHAKMLYLKELYVPAIKEFVDFKKTKPDANFDYEADAYIGLSRLKLDKRNASRNLAQMLRAKPEHKLNKEITYELGLYYFNKRKYARALKYLEQIEDTDIAKVKREELYFKQAYSHFKNKDFDRAKILFGQVQNMNGKYAVEAGYYYGYQCYILKDYDCALATFNKIGNKGPKTMQLYIAQIYYEQEKYEDAFETIKNVTLTKKKDEIELLKGKIQYQLGNKNIALTHFDKYTGDIKKLSSDEIYQFANANFEAEQFEKSTQYFILISNEDSKIGQAANYHLGVSDVKSDKKERALNAFAEAKRKDYNPKISEIAAYNYAKLAAELQQNSTAITAIKEFLDKYPGSSYTNDTKSMMADIFLSTKNYKAAIEILEDIGSLNDGSKKAYQELTFHRGEELYLNKEYQTANVFFKKSLKYPKERSLEALAYFWQAEIAYKVDDYDQSIRLMDRFMSSSASSKSKNSTYGYYSMGYNYFKKRIILRLKTILPNFRPMRHTTISTKKYT